MTRRKDYSMNAMDRLILSLFLGGPILLFMSHFWRRDVSPILTIWACQAMTWTTGRSKQWLVNDFIVFFDVPCFFGAGGISENKAHDCFSGKPLPSLWHFWVDFSGFSCRSWVYDEWRKDWLLRSLNVETKLMPFGWVLMEQYCYVPFSCTPHSVTSHHWHLLGGSFFAAAASAAVAAAAPAALGWGVLVGSSVIKKKGISSVWV